MGDITFCGIFVSSKYENLRLDILAQLFKTKDVVS